MRQPARVKILSRRDGHSPEKRNPVSPTKFADGAPLDRPWRTALGTRDDRELLVARWVLLQPSFPLGSVEDERLEHESHRLSEDGRTTPSFRFSRKHCGGEVRPYEILGKIAQRSQSRRRRSDYSVIGGMKCPVGADRSSKLAPRKGEVVGVCEQIVERNPKSMGPDAISAVDVELHLISAHEPNRLDEAAVVPWTPLRHPAHCSMLDQRPESAIQVSPFDQQIDVRERPQRRFDFIEVSDGRTLDDQELHASDAVKPIHHLEEAKFEMNAPSHRVLVARDRQIHRFGGEWQRACVNSDQEGSE
jgi:hypothetical protein